jgi:hypothetical protein
MAFGTRCLCSTAASVCCFHGTGASGHLLRTPGRLTPTLLSDAAPQEIKAIKVQQKAQPRVVAELQAAAAAAAAELAALRRRVAALESSAALSANMHATGAFPSAQLANLTAQVNVGHRHAGKWTKVRLPRRSKGLPCRCAFLRWIQLLSS